jgi:Transposase and inactivated derivatives
VAQVNDLSRSLTAFDPISTLVVVVEMSKASWLVSGAVPGVERQPLKKLEPDATALLRLIERWRNEAMRAGRPISRIALAYEAGRDGFWLARWLIARGIEAHVIHSASVAVSRERKRAKTDRLDAAMLMRVFLGWLRGERGHCGMVVIPTMEEEAARRPSRERESLVNERSRITNRMKSALARLGIRGFKPHLRKAPERLAGLRTAEGTGLPANVIEEFRRDMARLALVREQISSIEKTRAERLERAPDTGPHAMVRLLARVIGIGIETADMLVREILVAEASRSKSGGALRRAHGIARRERLKRREKGLAKAGNARVRRWGDPVGVALPDVPERQCAGALVSHADRGAERRAQDDDDRGTGAQATDRTVAPGHDRRGAGRCRATAGGVSNTLERERTNRVRHLTALDAPGSR